MAVMQKETRRFAEQVVAVYASRVTMNLLAQGELERAVMARITEAAGRGETPDPVRLANQALVAWESQASTRGPRITVVGNGRVVEKRTTH